MSTVDAAIASFERNIAAQTGKPVEAWAAAVRDQGLAKHGAMVAWLKAEHGLSHSHANHIAKHALEAAAPRSADDPVAHLFEDGREAMRPIYDRLAETALALGPDVEIAPKKANASVRRAKQFALIQPARTRVDLGLILRERAAAGRLEPAGSFNAMFTHRVKLGSAGDVDAEVLGWLAEAYEGRGRGTRWQVRA